MRPGNWKIPLFDFLGAPLMMLAFLLLLRLQSRRALRRQCFPAARRVVRNLAFATPSFLALRLVLLPVPLVVAHRAARLRFGLLNRLPLPSPVRGALGILLFDYGYYWWHFATHRVPFL